MHCLYLFSHIDNGENITEKESVDGRYTDTKTDDKQSGEKVKS